MATLQEQITKDIIMQLEYGSMSTVELSKTLKRNYYTVRGALRILLDQGVITPIDYSSRNGKFKLCNDQGPNRIMATVTHASGQKYKLIELLHMRHQKNSAASSASQNLPMHIARILRTAQKYHKGGAAPVVTLEHIKQGMETDRAALKAALSIYDQILENSSVWDADFLRRYPNDITWNEDEVLAAFHHYFEEDD